MKKLALIIVMIISIVLITTVYSQDFTYVGAKKCKMCHKSEKQGKQYPLWEEGKHSKSFNSLSTDAAQALAADATENPDCLKCHAPFATKAPEFKAEGVSCEVCHGPGSAYKKMSVMKDHVESVKNGLIEYGSPEAIKAQCATCHVNNPHDKPFDFTSAWEKVKHPKPKE
jgi:hypothetical protein